MSAKRLDQEENFDANAFLQLYLKPENKGTANKNTGGKPVKEKRKKENWQVQGDDLFAPQPGERTFSKRTLLSILLVALLIPVTIWLGIHMGDRRYFFISLVIITLSMVPFFVSFEGRKPQARELMVLAVLTLIAVAGRAAFFMLPHFKPVSAVVIISGVCFGPEAGFLVGAVSAFISNFFFGQGPWSPWQMFAFGLIGFFAGLLFVKGKLKATKRSLCTYGFLGTFFIYGLIMDTAAVLIAQQPTNWQVFLLYYISGAPINLVHAGSTVFFLAVAGKPMVEKLERIKIKYGLLAKRPSPEDQGTAKPPPPLTTTKKVATAPPENSK